jgi:MYXO-CTERM domain-containing protein
MQIATCTIWFVAATLVAIPALGADYYVAPDGSDNAAGTEDAPFATAQRGQQAASPGDTVYFRGGTYPFTGNSDIGVLFDKSGQDGARINYFAYPGETPVFDFNTLTPQARIRGFSVRANWLHFRGLELTGVQQILVDQNESWCIRVENGASNNIFELLNLHHNEGPGLFIADGGNNLVLNVDSHHNYDPDRGGENADGFGCHTDDTGNVFRGCRAWYNSDDGFDFINSPGVCTVEGSWSFRNGFVPDSNSAAGNGAGIKAGGFTNNIPATIPRHVVRFNLSFGNRSQGFYANHHEGGIDWINNTAFNNPRNFDMLADEGRAEHYLKNNLAAGSGEALARATANEIDDSSNSWSLGVSVSDADFVSTSDSGADGPRESDGSLPRIDFMRLADGSDLIDAGQDEGFPFTGDAPDLGAFEFGAVDPVVEPEPEDTGGQGGDPGVEDMPDEENPLGTGGADSTDDEMQDPAMGGGGNMMDPTVEDETDPEVNPAQPDPDDPSTTPTMDTDSPTTDVGAGGSAAMDDSDVVGEQPTTTTTDGTSQPQSGAQPASADPTSGTTETPTTTTTGTTSATSPAAPSVESTAGDEGDGCGCRVGAKGASGGLWFALLLMAALRRRRIRR